MVTTYAIENETIRIFKSNLKIKDTPGKHRSNQALFSKIETARL